MNPIFFRIFVELWPWWAGSLSLALIAVGFLCTFKRPLGVSGLFVKLLGSRDEIAQDNLLQSDEVQKELMEAMMAELGGAVPEIPEGGSKNGKTQGATHTPVRLDFRMAAAFLIMLVLGGLLAAVPGGYFRPSFAFPNLLSQFSASGYPAIVVSLAGGILVGFGTTMAGGCTSGHGLNGCGRLQIRSLLATGLFFGTAIVLSLIVGTI